MTMACLGNTLDSTIIEGLSTARMKAIQIGLQKADDLQAVTCRDLEMYTSRKQTFCEATLLGLEPDRQDP